VENYIKEAHPISSKSLCEILKCSSATVRNEMASLEDLGLLEKTHTSSGRIPSEKGYRYYVDNIMKPKELTGDDMLKLQTIFQNSALELNDVIVKSMEIISDLTNYTSIILGKTASENKISKLEVVPIGNNHYIGLVITDKGHVEHRNVFLDKSVEPEEIRKTTELINKLLVGTPINEVSLKLEMEVKPIIAKYVKQHEVLYNAFYNAFSDFTKEASVNIHRPSNILLKPEFSNVDKIRQIVSKFDDKNIIRKIEEMGDDNDVNIYIGSENEFDDDMTVIKTKYSVDGQDGTIALVGPKRMEYDRVITLLNYITENIKGEQVGNED
jgi:heat-inducible transcriptional repressor